MIRERQEEKDIILPYIKDQDDSLELMSEALKNHYLIKITFISFHGIWFWVLMKLAKQALLIARTRNLLLPR